MYKNSTTFNASTENLDKVISFVQNELSNCHLNKKTITKNLLLTEEIFISMVKNTTPDTMVFIRISKFFGRTKIYLRAKGTPIDTQCESSLETLIHAEEADDEETENIMRQLILSGAKDTVSLKHNRANNYVTIIADEPAQKQLIFTMSALVLGLIFGVVMRVLLPDSICTFLSDNIFTPVKTMFINALQMLIGPVVFFSIASSIGSYKDITELKKIGIRIFAFYMYTTISAIILSIILYSITNFGTFGQFTYLDTSNVPIEPKTINIIETIVGIVPNNIIKSFLDNETLQIIFLAIFVGIGISTNNSISEKVSNFFSNANELFLKLTTMITHFLPIMIFTSMACLVLSANTDTFAAIGFIAVLISVGCILMILFYLLNITLFVHESPITFIKKTFPAWLNAFALCSSNAAMPFTMETCKKKLKVHPKIFSFSIPLGATINMDGTTVILMTSTLVFAKLFGIELSPYDYVTISITSMILSFGVPGIAGSAIICAAIIYASVGIPSEALAISVTVYSLIDPIATANNVIGDIAGTYIVAKRTGNIVE